MVTSWRVPRAADRKYGNLLTLHKFENLSTQYKDCKSYDEVKNVAARLKHHSDAINDLLRQCRGAIADTKRAALGLVRLQHVDAQITEASKEPSKKARRATTSSIWETISNVSEPMRCLGHPVSEHDKEAQLQDLSQPVVISSLTMFKNASESKDTLTILSDGFKAKWCKWKAKTQEKRGAKPIKDERLTQTTFGWMHANFPDGSFLRADAKLKSIEAFAAAAGLSHFAIDQGEALATYEADGAGDTSSCQGGYSRCGARELR